MSECCAPSSRFLCAHGPPGVPNFVKRGIQTAPRFQAHQKKWPLRHSILARLVHLFYSLLPPAIRGKKDDAITGKRDDAGTKARASTDPPNQRDDKSIQRSTPIFFDESASDVHLSLSHLKIHVQSVPGPTSAKIVQLVNAGIRSCRVLLNHRMVSQRLRPQRGPYSQQLRGMMKMLSGLSKAQLDVGAGCQSSQS